MDFLELCCSGRDKLQHLFKLVFYVDSTILEL